MSIERVSAEAIIEKDLETGDHETFDHLVESLKQKSGAENDIMELAGSSLVQVDIGVETRNPHRLEVHRFEQRTGEETKKFSLWEVDDNGSPQSESHTYMSFPTDSGQRTIIRGSRLGSIDGMDLEISPKQVASRVDEALKRLNDHNWRIVVGRENVPQGEI